MGNSGWMAADSIQEWVEAGSGNPIGRGPYRPDSSAHAAQMEKLLQVEYLEISLSIN
jgi:hypothetical protein